MAMTYMNESSCNQYSRTEVLTSKEHLGRHLYPLDLLGDDGKASAWIISLLSTEDAQASTYLSMMQAR